MRQVAHKTTLPGYEVNNDNFIHIPAAGQCQGI